MRKKFSPAFLGAGIAIGTALGAAMHNLGAGMALGVVFGAAISVAMTSARARQKRRGDEPKP